MLGGEVVLGGDCMETPSTLTIYKGVSDSLPAGLVGVSAGVADIVSRHTRTWAKSVVAQSVFLALAGVKAETISNRVKRERWDSTATAWAEQTMLGRI